MKWSAEETDEKETKQERFVIEKRPSAYAADDLHRIWPSLSIRTAPYGQFHIWSKSIYSNTTRNKFAQRE